VSSWAIWGLLRHELMQYASNKKQLASLVVGIFVIIGAAGLPIVGMFVEREGTELRLLDSLQQRFPGYSDEVLLVGGAAEMILSFTLLFCCGFWTAFLGASAIASEKDQRTLESLLSLPVSDREILLGKVIPTALLPLATCWFCCGLAVTILIFVIPSEPLRLLLNSRLMMTALVTAPAVAVMIGFGATIPSVLVADTEAAQKFCVLPALGVMTGFLLLYAKYVIFGHRSVVSVTLCVLALDVVLFSIAVRLFNRERLLLKY
jgi:ABC-type Na+ efflux pump permease subunit